jgi:sugar phosphate isomerase/epimerase
MTQPPIREKNWEAFLRAIEILLKEAKALGLSLYIENNVTIAENILPSGESLLLCDSPSDVARLLNSFDDQNFGLLLDTGHLNVSSKTLNFNPEEMLKVADGRVGAIHHNDNNRMIDNNTPLTESYWFLPHVKRFCSAYHVLEVLRQTPNEITAQKTLLERAAQ